MKAVFDTSSKSRYGDRAYESYPFPGMYLEIAKRCVGDWIVYRRPRRDGGEQGYIAVAMVTGIVPDLSEPGQFIAQMSNYMQFDAVVPFSEAGWYYEEIVRNAPKRLVGATVQGKSIREISDSDFTAVVMAGMRQTFDPANAVKLELDDEHADEEARNFLKAPREDQEREIRKILLNKPIRAASFRKHVGDAYENTCAVTGIKITNGGGKAEIQAAHIWAVKDGGPDIVQNGIALSGTVHWLFDRHLITLSDEYQLLVSHNKIPSRLSELFYKHPHTIGLPKDQDNYPRLDFIRKHREKWMQA